MKPQQNKVAELTPQQKKWRKRVLQKGLRNCGRKEIKLGKCKRKKFIVGGTDDATLKKVAHNVTQL